MRKHERYSKPQMLYNAKLELENLNLKMARVLTDLKLAELEGTEPSQELIGRLKELNRKAGRLRVMRQELLEPEITQSTEARAAKPKKRGRKKND